MWKDSQRSASTPHAAFEKSKNVVTRKFEEQCWMELTVPICHLQVHFERFRSQFIAHSFKTGFRLITNAFT